MAFDYTNYTRLDYIKSTGGNQYLQLPTIQTDTDFTIEFEMSASSYSATWLPVSINCYNGGIWLGGHGGNFVVRIYNGSDYISVSAPTVDTFTKIKVQRVGTVTSLYFDDVLKGSYTNIPYVQDTGYATKLFTDESNFSQFSLRSYKYTYDGDVVHDLVPALEISTSRVGMYDVQNETFRRNWASTEFAYELCPYVSADVSPSGSGTVTGTGYYNTGSTATLTAVANNGYAFDYWELGYTKVDYIQSSGTQYIDTGFIPNQDTRIDLQFIPLKVSNDGLYVFGSGVSSTSRAFELYPWNGTFQSNFGTSSVNTVTATANTSYEVSKNKNVITLNSVTYSNTSNTFTSPYTLDLFALHRASVLLPSGGMKLYYAKIWDNGTLVRDYVPVIRNSDSAVGLLDLVNMKFYSNSGTGTFTYGEVTDTVTYSGNPISITVNGDLSLTANFIVWYVINLTYDSTLGSASYYSSGSSIVLSATPNSDAQFLGWYINSVPISTSNPYTYTPTGDVTIEARFEPIYEVTETIVGSGSFDLTRGTDKNDVTFNVIPSEHYSFISYEVNGTTYTTTPLNLHLTQNVAVTVTFQEDETYHISVSSNFPYGSFYLSGNDVYSGTTVTIWARPFPDYNFVRWSDGNTDNPRQITVTSNITLVAIYQRVADTNGIYQYRCYVKDQMALTDPPKAFMVVDTFDIRTDYLTNATSSVTVYSMASDVNEGDILVIYDPKGTTLYQGVIDSIEDLEIGCSQMQSFYKGTWIYNNSPQDYLEHEIANLLQDYADGKLYKAGYVDNLVAQRLGGITIDYVGSTTVNLPTDLDDEGNEEMTTYDMEEFIYELYQKYGIEFDFEINFSGANYCHIRVPSYPTVKVGNNMFAIQDMLPITEIEETNKLVIYAEDKTYRTTYVATKNGIVEAPTSMANRFNITNTEVVFSDDPVDDLVANNLPQTMFNHKIEFTLIIKNFLYEFGEFNLGGELDIYYGDDYYNSVLTGYEISKGSNQNIVSVHFICGLVRKKLTQLLTLGKV